MEKSNVYFTSFKATGNENLLQKLHRLMKSAGFETIDFNEKYAAIKIHFGEYGNLAFLRPNYAKVVADYVKELGGKPFLTDCNTLYVGSRKNALDHLETAYVNGFSPYQTGCHVLIADGLKGTNETLVPVNGEYVKEAKIGSAIMDADVFISRGMRWQDSAAQSRTSVWAAALELVRWNSTVRESQVWMRVPASAAVPAAGSVHMGRRSLQIGRQESTMTNAWAAADVLQSVRRMQSRQILQIRLLF